MAFAYNELKLYESLMVLALCEEKGTINGTYIKYTCAAAMLAELLLLNKIDVGDDRKNEVRVLDTSLTGDTLLDEMLLDIGETSRSRDLQSWVQRLGASEKIKHKVAQVLVEHGIVKLEEQKVLWLFTQKVYPEINPEPEKKLRAELRDAVFTAASQLEPRLVVLLSLVKSSRLLSQVFSKQELLQNKAKIEEIVSGESLGEAAGAAISAVETAVMIAVIIPAISAATSVTTA